jgi:hypothetical protein
MRHSQLTLEGVGIFARALGKKLISSENKYILDDGDYPESFTSLKDVVKFLNENAQTLEFEF